MTTPTKPMTFSDKPLRIAGVKYTPRWAWSEQYRKEFRKTYGFDRDAFNTRRDAAYRTAAYCAWYRKTHGREWQPTPAKPIVADIAA